MKKIDSQLLVCTAQQTNELISLGILPVACMCYELTKGKRGSPPLYVFAGEYMGQEKCIPAWTMEELNVLIGGEYSKPDIMCRGEFSINANVDASALKYEMEVRMMQFSYDYPGVKKLHANGAMASAELLIFGLTYKHLFAKDCNKRIENFYSKPFPNIDKTE